MARTRSSVTSGYPCLARFGTADASRFTRTCDCLQAEAQKANAPLPLVIEGRRVNGRAEILPTYRVVTRESRNVRKSGASRARTGDLLDAIQTLSQLSYGPVRAAKCSPELEVPRPSERVNFDLRVHPAQEPVRVPAGRIRPHDESLAVASDHLHWTRRSRAPKSKIRSERAS